ncbi:MAG: protein kinase domain-containing protein [Polyangiaceae bacterium]
MRDATFYASSLLDLHKLEGAVERRASWRQSIAALARATAEDGPGPLEGLHPEALLKGVQAALRADLVDDLDWLAPSAAGAALYELASALPLGSEQRELGRRVLARLLTADAETFVTIARRVALGAGRGLGSAAMRARVALVMELPLMDSVADAPLALALASRRDLAREWIGTPSTGSLPSRRLAARLIERAAREAARRAAQGDDHCLRVFRSDAVEPAWNRLLADRESLVWRHVAVARGLLAPWVPALARAIEEALAPGLSPTEWRRAATSMAAQVAVAPERGLELARQALAQGMLDRDPGAGASFVWGLPRAAEAEPEAALELLERVLERAGPEIGEAALDLRSELGESPVTARAIGRALELLSARARGAGDDGAEALALEVSRDLGRAARADEPIRDQIARGLLAFASAGAKEAHALARDALATARNSLDALEAVPPEEDGAEGRSGAIARRTSLGVLRDLDVSLLEHDLLAHLLSLGSGDAVRGIDDALDGLRDRLADWILAREGKPLATGPEGKATPTHPTLVMRRLRALLHLADGDMGADDGDPQRAARLRKRGLRIARTLLDRFERGPASPVRRTIIAALARSLDALVRVGACDVIDALLVVSTHAVDAGDLGTLAEASMDPNLVHVLLRYARFAEAAGGEAQAALRAYDDLTRDLALDASSRSEALRTVLVRLGGALAALASVASLRGLAPSGGTEAEVVSSLEAALGSLAQLGMGARGRLDPDRAPTAPPAIPHPLTIAVARVLSGADPSLVEHVVASSLDHLLTGIPKAIGKLVAATVWRLIDLPKEGAPAGMLPSLRLAEALPAWLPPRRTVGGFYVLRALSAGAVGSVFVVTRVEDKGEPEADKFALKVPEYSATAARSLSEPEFLKMFREEAGALIALPQHPNLAHFVTFDAGSKPKPILVMELVEGTTLERVLEARGLDMPRALRALDDMLSGLSAMHAVGVAHLDVKPSNVVLRRGEEAVLVDFGLAGRHLRPGCATGPYGAPEVWGALDGEATDSPAKADVYAFGCVAFETLTGRVLFDAETEITQIAMHVAHDGFPAPLRALAKRPDLGPVTELLFSTLRREARDRPTAAAVRKELQRITPALARTSWPMGA